jgi:hypothetical protein
MEHMIRDLGRDDVVARHRERSLTRPYDRTCWLGYCQYTPTDMLARDHD